MTRILLIRHAEPVSHRGYGEENERRLSEAGRAQAAALLSTLTEQRIAAVYTSPYPRARETVEPLAAQLGTPAVVIDDLRERVLSVAGRPDWLDHVRRSFADPDYALPDGESGRAAQARVAAVLDELATRHPGQTLVAASHGILIALALQLDDPAVGFDFWQALPMPAVYSVERGS